MTNTKCLPLIHHALAIVAIDEAWDARWCDHDGFVHVIRNQWCQINSLSKLKLLIVLSDEVFVTEAKPSLNCSDALKKNSDGYH